MEIIKLYELLNKCHKGQCKGCKYISYWNCENYLIKEAKDIARDIIEKSGDDGK